MEETMKKLQSVVLFAPLFVVGNQLCGKPLFGTAANRGDVTVTAQDSRQIMLEYSLPPSVGMMDSPYQAEGPGIGIGGVNLLILTR